MAVKKLINISDLTKEDLDEIFENTYNLKDIDDTFERKSMGMILKVFNKNKNFFQVGISHLKGNAIDLNFENLNIKRSESFECFSNIFMLLRCQSIELMTIEKLKKDLNFFKPIVNAPLIIPPLSSIINHIH